MDEDLRKEGTELRVNERKELLREGLCTVKASSGKPRCEFND